jgi:hypothetical protein
MAVIPRAKKYMFLWTTAGVNMLSQAAANQAYLFFTTVERIRQKPGIQIMSFV